MPAPIVDSNLTLELGDGTQLHATTDVALARLWAEHEHGAPGWSALSFVEQNVEVAAALRELRRAAGNG